MHYSRISLLILFLIVAVTSAKMTGAKRRRQKAVDLDYHQLKELREQIIITNQRSPDLLRFYADAAKAYKKWEQPKPFHLQRKPKTGEEVWFFNKQELWWQTGVVGNVSKKAVENGVWMGLVSPTQWPKNAGYTAEYMKILYPDKKRTIWQSQKACDLATLQKDVNDPLMEKRMLNLAMSIDESNRYPYIGLTRWFIARKQWESAYEMCQKALEDEKRWFLPYMYMGIIKRKLGQSDGAGDMQTDLKTSLRHFKEAMELNPSNEEAINNLAHFYYYIDKNHRKSCFWHRILKALNTAASRKAKNLFEHVQECDRIQHRFDSEEHDEL